MLFADNEFVAGANLVGCLLAGITGFFSWLTARDRLRFDASNVKMHGDLELLKVQHADCEERHEELKQEVQSLRQRIGSGHHVPLWERRQDTDPDYPGPERRKDA